MSGGACPYLLLNPRVELCSGAEKQGGVAQDRECLSLRFSFCNESLRTVSAFTLSFTLYDSEGNSPFVGSNSMVERCDTEVRPGEARECVISLDSYVSSPPDEPYIADYLYVRELLFADGSVWKDPYGMYCVHESYE